MERSIIDGQLVLKPTGDLLASQVQDLLRVAKECIETLPEDVQYDSINIELSRVSNIDSQGVTFLISIYKISQKSNKQFLIIGVNHNIFPLFQMIRLTDVFPVFLTDGKEQ